MKSWLPWRYLVSRIARRQGFLDPFTVMARLRQFSQPSEVQEPIELIRAGAAFHARGLVNTKVLQNNLDWVWPYWATRQFDPSDASFLPRAFSITHVNLTHRNWTALGLPGMEVYPIVDPRGMITPLLDAWSLDWWFAPADGSAPTLPSQCINAEQRLELEDGLRVVTSLRTDHLRLVTSAWVTAAATASDQPTLQLQASIESDVPGVLALAVRPANPEGVSFIDSLGFTDGEIHVNKDGPIRFDRSPTHWAASTYAHGDIAHHLHDRSTPPAAEVTCRAGLATGAALFEVAARGAKQTVTASMPVPARGPDSRQTTVTTRSWPDALAGTPTFTAPDSHWQFLHDAATRTLLLLSPHDIYPGPYTYRRFWFRDACLILNALVAANQFKLARELLAAFPERQKRDGYFHSQEGEWDANGQILWIADKIERADGKLLSTSLWKALSKGAQWITQKRVQEIGARHDGLLPPGFSAEHLGPNDFYYWDDFWGLAGLRAAARMAQRRGENEDSQRWHREANQFSHAIRESLKALPASVTAQGVPASPYRRMDSGAIGSMVADYPLQLDELGPERFQKTADWLAQHCLHEGGFFQDMIHSGINAYLTLDLAQTLLRAGDSRYLDLMDAVATAASPTGQWPEAIHPRTGGGCMGDGQHAWAAAEWILMIRALFVREEANHLVIGAGLPEHWFNDPECNTIHYGPTATSWGPITVHVERRSHDDRWVLRIEAHWHGYAPHLEIRIPGFQPVDTDAASYDIVLEPVQAEGCLIDRFTQCE
ncbi:hypothetical protein [Synoicihabitans lomoniglobus]|uniref:Uncharacterized protein n=1 Tax=Synoicihabitans lomoniglobus TaxID=2909285 RepID=A0AAF0A017_9BACT|nr:hypothetical protein [Opitutaceae bacterium LMO-M01]WED64693.1 hypothetical protein PXH66_20305 [Opitutaceae bacterium LMO-M01]